MADKTASISDLLGLNSPRGLLGNHFWADGPSSRELSSPPFAEVSGNSQRNLSLTSSSSVPSSSFFSSSPLRSTSLSDTFGSSSPGGPDPSMLNIASNSRSNSPADSDNSPISTPDGNLAELLNSITLGDALIGNVFGNFDLKGNLDLLNLQNLQAVHALKCLQQSPPHVLNTHFNPPQQRQLIDKWNNHPSVGLMTLANQIQENSHLDKIARYHLSAANIFKPTCTWSGVLPLRSNKTSGFSSKVFLGGVPWDITETMLVQTFKPFGSIRVEWPGKDKQMSQPKGYVYIIFESEKNVKMLLASCTNDFSNSGNWYYKISSKKMKAKEVQVIPWILCDSNYTQSNSQKLDSERTVFVGALHGMLNAEGLAKIMNDLFDGVIYAGIDTDKYKYPIGSGRVTFNNSGSYMKAVAAAFVEIKTAKFIKKIQIDPYLEDAVCSTCNVQQGSYFCRELSCFRYFCRTCWNWQHLNEVMGHKPLIRASRNNSFQGTISSGGLSGI